MSITEIKQFPIRVKLNSNFGLDLSFDKNTILQLNSVELDFIHTEGCSYKVYVTALGSDLEYNKSIASRNWMNLENKNYELDIFEFYENVIGPNGDFDTSIFVMGDDDCFDLVDELKVPKYSTEDILIIISEVAPHLKAHITETNVQQFIDGLKRKDQLKRK
jgi:hypothetical protein